MLPKSVEIQSVDTLATGRYSLHKYTFKYHRPDGSLQILTREVCKRGDSVVVLLYCRSRGTVILTRQFRLPLFVGEGTDGFVELPGGLIDESSPADAACREAEEETGIRIINPQQVLTAYMSPAVLSERVHFCIAAFEPHQRVSMGGGLPDEGEDIEVIEVAFDEALRMIEHGEITDGRTIVLLYYARLHELCGSRG